MGWQDAPHASGWQSAPKVGKKPNVWRDRPSNPILGWLHDDMARAAAKAQANHGKANLGDVAGNAALFGFGDELAGATNVIRNAVTAPFSSKVDFDPVGAFKQGKANTEQALSDYSAAHPVKAVVGNVLGAAASVPGKAFSAAARAPTLIGRMAQGAKAAAPFGALQGLGAGGGNGGILSDLIGRGESAGLGALGAAGLGAALPVAGTVLAPVGRAIARPFAPAASRALRAVSKALRSDAVTPAAAGANMDAARALGYPAMLADQGVNTARLAGAVARHPGPARTMMATALEERMGDQNNRVLSAIERDLGPTASVAETSDALSKGAKAAAGPLYDQAFAGGSVAPLEHQFGQAFAESSGQVSAATKALAAAQRRATQAAARQPAASNVYAASAANRGSRNAVSEVTTAQQKLAAAQAQHEANLNRLRQAQADGSANAPGAVWSPRIQQFLDDPIAKAGLAKGLEVQRLEALAEDKPFNPTEYAITGADEAGNPIVAAVPNMRTLDAVKRGLDETINAYPKDIGGRVILDQRGRAVDQVRRAFLKHIDEVNPDYAAARGAFAGPMQEKEALTLGQSMVGKRADQIRLATKGMTESQRAQFDLGYRSGLSDKSSALVDKANRPNMITGSPGRREALQQVFGSNPNLPRFIDTLGHEGRGIQTHNIALTGSPTAVNLGDDALVGDGSILGDAAGDAFKLARGGVPLNLFRRAVQSAGDAVRFGTGNTGESVRQGIASLLSESDPMAFQRALAAQQAAMDLARQRAGVRMLGGGQIGGSLIAMPPPYQPIRGDNNQ